MGFDFDKYYTDGDGNGILADDYTWRLACLFDFEGLITEKRNEGQPDIEREKGNLLCEAYEPTSEDDAEYAAALRYLYQGYKDGLCTKDDFLHLQFHYPPNEYSRAVLKKCGIVINP